jgi:hypothetical protein
MNNLSILPNDIIADEPPAPPIKALDVLLRPPVQPPAVRVVDFEMSFSKMVGFMVKLSFAAIPAAFIIMMIWALCLAILAAIGGR